MTYENIRKKVINQPLFTFNDILKWFPKINPKTLEVELSRWRKDNKLIGVKKGIYWLKEKELSDPFIVANFIYNPSYISMESALNYYSIIPDIPFAVTSVTVKKTAQFKNKDLGNFTYRHLKPELFWGYETVQTNKVYNYNVATPEKALLDYIYLNAQEIPIDGFPNELRFYFEKFEWKKFSHYSKTVPQKNIKFHKLIDILLKKYA